MKKKFSKAWKGSKKPAKKRKYAANAPLHIKKKMLSANLSKDLRKKHGKRSIVLRKNDVVKATRGKFKGKKGKVLLINVKKSRVEVEEMQTTKQDGSKINIPIAPSNLQVVELSLEDKTRLGPKVKKEKKVEKSKEEKPAKKEKKKAKEKSSKKKDSKKSKKKSKKKSSKKTSSKKSKKGRSKKKTKSKKKSKEKKK